MSQTRCLLNKRLCLALATAAVVGVCASPARSAGLGAGAGSAVLGQSLDFAVNVRIDGDENLTADCLLAEVHFGDRRVMPSQVHVLVEPPGADGARVRVLANASIDEPVVAIQLTAACGNRVSRRYVVLADPPMIAFASAITVAASAYAAALPDADAVTKVFVPSAASGAPSRERSTRSAASADAVVQSASAWRAVALRQPAEYRAPQRARAQPRAARRATALRVATAPTPAASRRARHNKPSLPQLRLDMAEPLVAASGAVEQALQLVAQAASAARQSAAAASAAADRIAALERTVDQMRGEAQRSRSQAELLRDQLARTESSSSSWPLGVIAAALALLAGWLALRLSATRQAQEAAWRNGTPEARQAAIAADAAERPPTAAMAFVHSDIDTAQLSAPRTRPAPAWPPPSPADGWEPSQPPDTESPRHTPRRSEAAAPLPSRVAAKAQVLAPQAASAARQVATQAENEESVKVAAGVAPTFRDEEHAARDVSIDELLDLEQQADFFVVLGQDDAAIDLLVEHLRHAGGRSPLPYLKLLEIHRRRGERSDYERVRARFNHRFNAYAPEWEVDLQSGRLLDDYPGLVQRLQQVWARPLDSMAELEALMFRKSQGELFDLPAYREVLFLYTLARDLLDRESAETGKVDLLLPLSDGGEFSSTAPMPFMELGRDSHHGPADFEDRPTAPVDLDLSLDGDRPASIFDPLEDSSSYPRAR